MLRIVSRRELLLYAAQISDFKQEIKRLQGIIEHERRRAEAAINLLLMRTVKAAITPTEPLTLDQEDAIKERAMDIFGDGKSYNEDEALEKLQE